MRCGASRPFLRAWCNPPLLASAGIRGAGGASLHFLPARCGASPPVPERAGSAHPPVPATRAPPLLAHAARREPPSSCATWGPLTPGARAPLSARAGTPGTRGVSPHFLRSRRGASPPVPAPAVSSLLLARAPLSCLRGAGRAPNPVPARAGPALPSASAARDHPSTPAHAEPRKASLPARVVLYETPGFCARGSSNPFPGHAGQPYPGHARRQPPFLPARRSARHRFLGAWRETLPSCAGGGPPPGLVSFPAQEGLPS